MKWIKRGRQIGLAVKNVNRFREILRVFARHGFADIVTRMKLDRFLPSKMYSALEDNLERPTEVRLRIAFEQLGPTFVKLGQLLSSRPDLIPEAYVEELSHLQDDVRTLPFETIREVVEAELGKPLSSLFASFDEKPLGAASIAQVHAAVLHSGEHVVVKVQRPGIARTVSQDVALLEQLAKLLEHYVPESRIFGPTIIVDEFFRTLKQELDFAIEGNNVEKIGENLKDFPDVTVPKLYKALSTHRVLVLERFEGIKLSDLPALRASGMDLTRINEVGARAFFKTVMIDGVFHGDLHGGNVFVLPGAKLGLIDFGIVGRLSERSRQQLSNMVIALMTEDFEALCYQYAELGSAGPTVDFDGFQREVRNSLAPYLGLKVGEVNTGQVLIEATKIATKYQIRVPGEWMLVFKALFTMEGMGRALDPNFDMMSLGKVLAVDLVKDQYSPEKFTKEFMWIAKDLVALAQVLPRQIRWMFKKWNADGYAFEVRSPDLQELSETVDRNGRRLSGSLIASALFIASAVSLGSPSTYLLAGYPVFTVVTFVIAIWVWWRS